MTKQGLSSMNVALSGEAQKTNCSTYMLVLELHVA